MKSTYAKDTDVPVEKSKAEIERLPLPGKEDYTKTEAGQTRHKADLIERAWEQGYRARWRALCLGMGT